MQVVRYGLVIIVGAWMMASCKNAGGVASHPTDTGPFDSRGNYIEEWADNPAKWNRSGGAERKGLPLLAKRDTAPKAEPRSPQGPPPQAQRDPSQVATRSSSVSGSQQAARPNPKPVVKPKPQPKIYVVRAGDNLSKIARSQGSTVSEIQRANGITGSLIRPGQKLKIPK